MLCPEQKGETPGFAAAARANKPIPRHPGSHRSAVACVLWKKRDTGQEELCVHSKSLPGAYADMVGYCLWLCLRTHASSPRCRAETSFTSQVLAENKPLSYLCLFTR